MSHRTEPTPLVRSPRDRWSIIVGLAAIVIAIGALFLSLQHSKGETADQRAKKNQAQGQAATAQQDQVDFAEKVADRCAKMNRQRDAKPSQVCKEAKQIVAQGPQGLPGAPGAPGAPGPGPSDTQVAAAVATYCTTNSCKGAGPSQAQVAAAVATYCTAGGQCRGPAGDTGQNGDPGSPGSPGSNGSNGEPGARGPGPTDGQVADAVASYCSNHSCRGADGQNGQDGAPGPAGPEGPQGPPGPDCPAGYTGRSFQVETGDSAINTDQATIFACVPN